VDVQRRFQSPRPIAGFVTGDQGMGHIVVGIRDMDESLAFYRDGLGLRVSDYVRAERPQGGVLNLVFLHCNPRHHSIAFGKPGTPEGRLNHLMLQVRELDDLGTTFDLVQAEGIEGTSRLGRHPNDEMVSFYVPTPSGFGIEYGWGARTVHDDTWQVTTYTTVSNWGHGGRTPPRAPAAQPVAARA
jgi:2,3-dihydroxybiphenyl 1,2-dioxygenase